MNMIRIQCYLQYIAHHKPCLEITRLFWKNSLRVISWPRRILFLLKYFWRYFCFFSKKKKQMVYCGSGDIYSCYFKMKRIHTILSLNFISIIWDFYSAIITESWFKFLCVFSIKLAAMILSYTILLFIHQVQNYNA